MLPSANPNNDIVIIGGGASGIAVAVRLLESGKQKPGAVKSIAIVEQDDSIGPGLAYSKSCTGTFINMHADTMGLHSQCPSHFSEWMRQQAIADDHQTGYPERECYGQYLQWLVQRCNDDAAELGIDLHRIQGQVSSITRSAGALNIILKDTSCLVARNAVLAVGNFAAKIHPELEGTSGYHECPWPVERLQQIQKDSSVAIIGSRLTAIDAAISLYDHGHRGPITLLSRNGMLPKVQGPDTPHFRRYALSNLARAARDDPKNAFTIIQRGIREEIELRHNVDWSSVMQPADAPEQLLYDIGNAERGETGWQAVLKATTSFAEQYWHCISD